MVEGAAAQIESDKEGHKKRAKALRTGGFYMSAGYLIIMIVWAVSEFRELLAMKPNEFGDLLAGVFSPLAFLWLVLGFLQQGQELQASVNALELQGEELRNSVEQQRALVEVSRAQVEADLSRIRSEAEAAEHRAQPKFIGSIGASYTGDVSKFGLHFKNVGPQCSSAQIICDGEAVVEKDHLSNGGEIVFVRRYGAEEERAPFAGAIQYYDANGNQRRMIFNVEADQTAGPNGRPALTKITVDPVALRPPFSDIPESSSKN